MNSGVELKIEECQLLEIDGLNQGQCHLWCFTLNQPVLVQERLLHWLSQDEVERRDRYAFEHLRLRFQVGRGLLRLVLSRYLLCDPKHIHFEYGKYGRPGVVGGGVSFNVSHSGDVLVIAVMKGADIGVDVELEGREADTEALVTRYFHPEERSRYDDIGNPMLKNVFFLRLWSCKEAYLKMLGLGLSGGLDSIDIRVPAGGGVCQLRGEGVDFVGEVRSLKLDLGGLSCFVSYCANLVPSQTKITSWGALDGAAWPELA